MSNPEPGKDYYDYIIPGNSYRCPYCNSPDQDGEDLGDHTAYLSFTCIDCDRDFSMDTVREEYYDEKGNVIK